jgi:hypothetical protein
MSFRVRDPAGANVQFREVKVAEPPFFQWLKVVGLLLVIFGGMRLCSLLIL